MTKLADNGLLQAQSDDNAVTGLIDVVMNHSQNNNNSKQLSLTVYNGPGYLRDVLAHFIVFDAVYSVVKVRRSAPERCSATSNYSRALLCHL